MIYIVGKATTNQIASQIKENLSKNMIFENRRADYDEIAAQCKASKYVLFPYVGDSISSSGVLIDTIQMGGTPVGPNCGAFADLQKEGYCITYSKLEDVFELLNKPIKRNSQESINRFVQVNSSEGFGNWIYERIESTAI